jgi:multicomponent Na+:H+ antiporter subunit G
VNGARDLLVLVLAWSGALLVLLASIGVLRMPDVFSRMHASSKAATLGATCSVLAAAFHFGQSEIWFRSLALGAFLFLTAPIAAHLIARAAFVTRAPLARENVVNEAATFASGRRESDGTDPGAEIDARSRS